MKKPVRSFVAALAAVVSVGGFAACKSAEPYAAKVNRETLSTKDLYRELDAMNGNKKYLAALKANGVDPAGTGNQTYSTAFVAKILSREILYKLIDQEFVRRKLSLSKRDLDQSRSELVSSIGDASVFDAFPASYKSFLQRVNGEVDVLQNQLAKTTDANLRQYYADHLDKFESVCAAHILVATKPEADEIEKALTKAKDKQATFADLAKKRSTDKGSGANGGDLGCAAPGGYVAEFKDAVRTQKIGVIGQPVKSQFGYHIIRVDKRDAAKPFEEVKNDVRTAITDSQQGSFNEFLVEAAGKAKVEVNPRFGTYDTTGDTPQVVPPKAPAAK